MKSLKIPKEETESVNQRRTDNTMAKGKRTNIITTLKFFCRLCEKNMLFSLKFA